jgi:hypothetical protein
MRALRIFPHIVANIIWPFSKRTRNIVFGNLSSTTPEKTITSSFAMYKPFDFLSPNNDIRPRFKMQAVFIRLQ